MRLKLALLGFLAVLGLAAQRAQADLPELVKRYIDDTTLIVGRIDVSQFSDQAVIDFLSDLMREAPEYDRERALENLREGLAELEKTLGPLRERGITSSWFVVGPDTFIMDEPALNIVPVADDEQAKLVTDLLKDDSVDHARVEGAVLISSRSKLSQARNPHPVERPNLEKAISVGRNAPAFQMAFEPTPVVRLAAQVGARELIAQVPQIPIDVVDLIGVMETMSLAMGLPPRAGAALSIDFPDTESAELAQQVVEGQVKRLEERLARRAMEPGRAAELTATLAPEARNRRVVIELTNEELRQTVGPIMVITMLQSREGGMRVRAGRNLRTLTAAILLWSYEHGEGRLPPDLASVEQVFDPKAERMSWRMVNTNPRFAQENAYAYVRCADRLDEIAEPDVTVIAYEKPPPDGVREGVNVAFADGRVEWLSAADFEELSRSQGFEIERLAR